MSNKLIGYDNKLWRVEQEFSYTGEDQLFTLEPGTYLFICEGAHGGKGARNIKEYGGITYGEITLNETTTFHAVVGSDGADCNMDYALCTGGFNGGAHGGMSYSSTYSHGPGGGGATDIRLLPYDPDEYPSYNDDGSVILATSETLTDTNNNTYTPLEYIYAIGGGGNSGYFNTGYIPKANTKIETEVVCYENTIQAYEIIFGAKNGSYQNNAFVFFSRFNSNNIPVYNRSGVETRGTNFLYNEKIKIVCYQDKAEWFFGNSETPYGSIATTGTVNDCICPLLINTSNNATSNSVSSEGSWNRFKLYSFKISEIDSETGDETVIKNYVPARRDSDSVTGLFDKVNNTFISPTGGGMWLQGPPKTDHPSLNSRIMVAAGAGGGNHQSDTTDSWTNDGYSHGGGPYGSCSPGYSTGPDGFCDTWPTQTDGYAFGYGCYPTKRTTTNAFSAEGCGGGGGGWYSGYASIPHNQNTAQMTKQGGGGSSYVLTASSYKPDGYDPDAKYYFTKVSLHGAQAMGDLFSTNPLDWNNGHVYICKLEENIKTGDIIVYPCTGNAVSHDLPAGKYKLKVWGGDGGSRGRTSHCVKGGYSEGVINTQNDHTIYVYTGGSGGPRANVGYTDAYANTMAAANLSSLKFNGGKSIQNCARIESSSGGGTDIRFDVDDLYHRVIVAGGAGSEGRDTYLGGVGGGETGGSASSAGCGTNNGPGTQSSGYAFGEGGPGYNQNSGYGGCGGGGWYGGYGTTPDGSRDDDRSGAGGSGFVLTADTPETSIPNGYGCDEEEYYLTEATTVQGGNMLPIWHTKTQIEVISIAAKCICRDADGYKYYDKENGTWTLLENQTITPETFMQYGQVFTSDEGLGDSYYIYLYDESTSISKIKLNVVPLKQKFEYLFEDDIEVSNIKIDTEAIDGFDIYASTKLIKNQDKQLQTVLDVFIDYTSMTDQTCKIYGVQFTRHSKNQAHEYLKIDPVSGRRLFKHYYVDPEIDPFEVQMEERTMELDDPDKYKTEDGRVITKYSLLPVGSSTGLSSNYRMDIVDGEITTVYNTHIAEHNRSLFIGYVGLDGTGVWRYIIKEVNLRTFKTVSTVCNIPWRTIYTPANYATIGSFLMDDNYFYLQMQLTNGSTTTYRQSFVRIKRDTSEISFTSTSGEAIGGYGHACWYDDHTILTCGNTSFMLFDTIKNTWTKVAHGTFTSFFDFCVGNKQILVSYNNKLYVCDKETFTCTKTITVNASYSCRLCFDGDHKFYCAQKNYMYEYDETESDLTNTAIVSAMQYPHTARYGNGVVFVNQHGNDQRIVIYRTKTRDYISEYTPWYMNSDMTASGNSAYLPLIVNGVYYYLNRSFITVVYTGYQKYNFGPRTNQHYIYFEESESERMTYDERFMTLHPSYMEFHNGYIDYDVLGFDSNCIGHTGIIEKSSYQKLNHAITEISEGGD